MVTFGLFCKTLLLSKDFSSYVLGTFRQIWATFYFNIWSHWLAREINGQIFSDEGDDLAAADTKQVQLILGHVQEDHVPLPDQGADQFRLQDIPGISDEAGPV